MPELFAKVVPQLLELSLELPQIKSPTQSSSESQSPSPTPHWETGLQQSHSVVGYPLHLGPSNKRVGQINLIRSKKVILD